MDEHIAHLIREIPSLNAADVRVSPLVGGITNQNYRLDSGRESLVLRVGGKGTQLLGIDREREYQCTSIAAQIGVGAPVVHFLASEDALVTRFIAGDGVTPETAAEPATMRRIVAAMQCYHAGPSFPGSFSPFATGRS